MQIFEPRDQFNKGGMHTWASLRNNPLEGFVLYTIQCQEGDQYFMNGRWLVKGREAKHAGTFVDKLSIRVLAGHYRPVAMHFGERKTRTLNLFQYVMHRGLMFLSSLRNGE